MVCWDGNSSKSQLQICVDLSRLNESVCRERHPLPVVEQVLAQLTGAKLFSKLDANSRFWQIPLSPESALPTTFITPFGRFCFHRLPFGITSAPEHFQKTDALNSLWCRGSALHDGLYSGPWQD